MTDTARVAHRISSSGDMRFKPRFFLAMHPDDREKYLEKLIKLLHDQQDCVVYYAEGTGDWPAPEAEDFTEVLDDMQLIVAAVTGRLLKGPNGTMDRIIPYAADHAVPVLPLMMEEDLDKEYKERFGDLQYLMPDDRDRTAVPFRQKLRAFLEDVIVSDETAKRVRDAFDALVFLSYRKKDRAYARELMRMVHRNDRWRDIAFWYDEFLIPGEDFNDGIQRSLDESDLFMLVVTPSLLEDPNFVKDHEYPAALGTGKKIFPVEMRATDRWSLKRRYRKLPPCTKGNGDGKWNAALEEQVRKLAVRTRRDDPEHKFLIGLAYLDGINMEVDTRRAVTLITEAAQAGLEEAMRRLGNMYAAGKGVKRNADEALRWQQELCDRQWEKYQNGPENSPDEARAFMEMMDRDLNKLTDRLYKVRKIPQLYSCLHSYRILLEQTEDSMLPGRKHSLAVCLSKIGDIEMIIGDSRQAERSYRGSAEIFDEILAGNGSDSAKRDLYIARRQLSRTLLSRNEREDALSEIEHTLEVLQSIDDPEYLRSLSSDLAGMYQLRGKILAELRRDNEAGENYKKGLAIAKEAYAFRPNEKTLSGLCDCLDSLRVCSFRNGDREAGKDFTRQEITIVEKQLEEADNKGSGTGKLWNQLGFLHDTLGENDAAADCYRAGLAAEDEDPDSAAAVKVRMDASFALSELEAALGHTGESEKLFRQGVCLGEQLVEKTGSPEYTGALADHLERRAGEDADLLEEAFEWRQRHAERMQTLDNRIRRDSLRMRIDWMYQEHPDRKKPRVMICVSDDDLREQIRTALEGLDCRICLSRPSVGDLPQWCGDIKPDLVILGLPREGGKDLEPLHFTKRSICPEVRVIAIAHRADNGAQDEAMALGAADCLSQPLDPEELRKKAARQCDLIMSRPAAE